MLFGLPGRVLLPLAAALMMPPLDSAFAQPQPHSNASLSGLVQDASGAAVPRAQVHLHGKFESRAAADESGRFLITALPAGSYELHVSASGFAEDRRSLSLSAAGPNDLVVTLRPAALIQTLDVFESAGAVETVSKLPESPRELARAVTVVNAGEMRDRNLRSAPEMLAFVPGFSPNSFRAGGYHFYARGYRMGPDDTRIDGFAGLNVGGGFGASLFGIEEAVVLRGPAGLLYGASASPGGMINLVSKRPRPQRATRLDLRGGAYAGRGWSLAEVPSFSFDFDSTGALTRNERVLYRTLFTLENQRYFSGNVLDRNRYANAQLTFKLDPLGLYTLTPVVQYARMARPAGGGIVMSPSTSLTTNDGISGPIYLNDLSPLRVNSSAGSRTDETGQAGFDFRAVPTERTRFNLAYRNLRMDTFLAQWTPQVSTAAQIAALRTQFLVQRLLAKSDTDRRYHNVDANGSYEFRGATWKNLTQLGAYTRVTNTRATTPLGPVPAAQATMQIYTGQLLSPLNDNYPAIQKGAFAATTAWNGYMQNRTGLLSDRIVFTLGLGYGQNHPGGAPVQKGDLMPNASLLVNVTRQLAAYASYSTSFNPTDPTLENAAGQRGTFGPVRGSNYEAGLKFDSPSRRLSTTLSLFENRVENALVQTGVNDLNPNGNRYYVESGTRRAKGAELTANYRLMKDWFVTGAAAYTSAWYTGEGPASAASTLPLPGSPAEKTPRWSWNARTHYQRSEGRLAGLGGSFALLWQDARLGSNGPRTLAAPDPLIMPAYTRIDAALFYRFNRHLDLALNVENLFDRVIFVNASVGSAMEIAPPRTATLRLSYQF